MSVMLCAMSAMLVLGLSIPNAFGDDGVLFGVTYLIVTVLFVVLYLRRHSRPAGDASSGSSTRARCTCSPRS